MKLRLYISFLSVVFSLCIAQTNITGNIDNYVDSYIDNLPGSSGNNYQEPSSANLSTWSNAVNNLLQGNYSTSQTIADSIGYRVVAYTDNTVSPNKLYYILERKSSSTNHWGMFILNPASSRTKLFIQSPHPKFDAYTGQQGFFIFKVTGARAFFVSGTHRCNNSTSSSCSGTTDVCGTSGPYKISDQAHNVNATLQKSTEVVNSAISGLIVIQVHGFGREVGDPDMIMGNGRTTTPSGNDNLLAFKKNMLKIVPSLTFKIAHIDTDWNRLTGTTNVQGRLINGNSTPCTQNSNTPNGRFLHIEQVMTGLRDNQTNWKKVAHGIAMTVPINPAQSGNWSSASTWPGSVIPDSMDYVQVLSGQTLTVDVSNARCNNVTFESSTSKISLSSGSKLSVYGDFTLFSTSHNAFSSWSSGAKLCFAGGYNQLLSGWSTSSSSTVNTTLMEMQVDKSYDTLRTPGTDMKLSLGTSLEIIRGTFFLDTLDDINGKSFDGSIGATPSISVQSNGRFLMHEGASSIRSGSSGSNPIGIVTIYGSALFASSSSIGINFDRLDAENGSSVNFYSFSNSQPNNFKCDTLNIKSGAYCEVNSQVNFWNAGSVINLNANGKYRINGSASSLPPVFNNNGLVEYYRFGDQTVYSGIYSSLKFTGSGNRNLSGNITVKDTLMFNGPLIQTSSYSMTMGNGVSSLGVLSRDSGYVVGNFKRWFSNGTTSYKTFPVGTDNYYRPANISFTTAPGSGGTISASFTASDPGYNGIPLNDNDTSIVNVSPEGFWTLNAGDGLSGGTYSMNLNPAGFSGFSNFSTLRIIKRPTGGAWGLNGQHIYGTTVVRRTGLNGFSEYAIAGSTDNPITNKSFRLTGLLEGFYDTLTNTMVPDTVTIVIRNYNSPFNSVDSFKTVINSSGITPIISLSNVSNETNYYLTIYHRNSIETWSGIEAKFISDALNFDLTTGQSKAFGNNLIKKGSKWCIYSGDVNGDGQISLDDLLQIDSDNQNFLTGYVLTDVNGDGQVTLDDLLITDSNNQNFISVQRPVVTENPIIVKPAKGNEEK